VHLAGLQGDAVAMLAVREARQAVRADTGKIGKLEVKHATSIGKAMLTWLPEEEIGRMLDKSMKRFTDNTITELPVFLEAPRTMCRDGFALDREEFPPGVICIGAAIRDQAGTVIGGISAATPSMHASEEHIAPIGERSAPPLGHDLLSSAIPACSSAATGHKPSLIDGHCYQGIATMVPLRAEATTASVTATVLTISTGAITNETPPATASAKASSSARSLSTAS